jgi:hypothetical protein
MAGEIVPASGHDTKYLLLLFLRYVQTMLGKGVIRMTSVIKIPTQTPHLREEAPKRRATLQTTLYDLIEAMQEVVAPDEDRLVIRTIVHLFDTGRITFPAAETGTSRAGSSEEIGVYNPPHGRLSPARHGRESTPQTQT